MSRNSWMGGWHDVRDIPCRPRIPWSILAYLPEKSKWPMCEVPRRTYVRPILHIGSAGAGCCKHGRPPPSGRLKRASLAASDRRQSVMSRRKFETLSSKTLTIDALFQALNVARLDTRTLKVLLPAIDGLDNGSRLGNALRGCQTKCFAL